MISSRTFGSAAALLIFFWVISDIWMGFARNPIDDHWTGAVSIINGNTRVPVDATMELDMLDSGWFINQRPGTDNRAGARLTFDGKGVSVLQRLGLSDVFLASESRTKYKQGFCEMTSFYQSNRELAYDRELHVLQKPSINFTSEGEGCFPFKVSIHDFDRMEFAVDKPGYRPKPNGVIYAYLERDSRVSFIQRFIMRMRFSSWVADDLGFALSQTDK